jgi:hypothetical protein
MRASLMLCASDRSCAKPVPCRAREPAAQARARPERQGCGLDERGRGEGGAPQERTEAQARGEVRAIAGAISGGEYVEGSASA